MTVFQCQGGGSRRDLNIHIGNGITDLQGLPAGGIHRYPIGQDFKRTAGIVFIAVASVIHTERRLESDHIVARNIVAHFGLGVYAKALCKFLTRAGVVQTQYGALQVFILM